MRKQILSTIILSVMIIVSNLAYGQSPSVVTFQDNYFRVNGQFFFPIGWYGTFEYDVAGRTSGLQNMRNAGANVVLQYSNTVIDCYHPSYGDCEGNTNRPYDDPNAYVAALGAFLDAADSASLRVIVHLPIRNVANTALLPPLFLQTVVQSATIRNHSALLGWYQADEPEGDVLVTLANLQQRYTDIRSAYTGTGQQPHPVFVVFANSKDFRQKFNVPNGQKFYDVLMADNYPIAKNDPMPSPELSVTSFQSEKLDSLWGADAENTATSGSMMFVAQGYGEHNDETPTPERNIFGLQENFDDGVANDWAAVSGSWSVTAKQYVQTNSTNSNTNTSRSLGQEDWATMFYYSWDVSFQQKGTSAGMHILASDDDLAQRGNSYLIWQYNSGIRIYETINDILYTRATFSNFTAAVGTTYKYEVEYYFDSGLIKVWRNGVYVGSWTDATPRQSGQFISLRTDKTEARFDNIIASTLRRDPTFEEVKFSYFSPFYFSQNQTNLPGNLGGILFWDYDYANSQSKNNVNTFISYFVQNNFGDVFRQPSLDAQVSSGGGNIGHRFRKYGDDYFLLLINLSTPTVANRTITINDIGNTNYCIELKEGTGNNIWKGLSSIGEGDYQFTETLAPFEVKVYKLQPGFQEIVYGMTNGKIFKNFSGRWGDTFEITNNSNPVEPTPFPAVNVTDMAKYEKGDGDNGDEVIIAFADGKVFHQGSGNSNDAYKFLQRSGKTPTAVEGLQLDGIGLNELIVGFSDGKVYKSNGTWGDSIRITDPDFPPLNTAITDIAIYEKGDGDNAKELIIAFANGNVYKQDSGNNGDAHLFMQSTNSASANAVAGADLNGDGIDELIVGFSDGTLFRSNGTWGNKTPITDTDFNNNGAITDLAVYQKDTDIAKELIVVFANGKVCIQNGISNNLAQVYVNRGIAVNSAAGVDLDGTDGKDEIVVGFSNGEISADANGTWESQDIFRNGSGAANTIVGANLDGNITIPKNAFHGDMNSPKSEETNSIQIKDFFLSQNYPNPFNPQTKIKYSLPTATYVKLRVFNMRGQEITTLVNVFLPAGVHEVEWDARDFPSGIYVYRLDSPQFSQSRKLLLLK